MLSNLFAPIADAKLQVLAVAVVVIVQTKATNGWVLTILNNLFALIVGARLQALAVVVAVAVRTKHINGWRVK